MKKTIQFHGKPISYLKTGSGPALVLLHGFPESSAIWKAFIAVLSHEFTVIAPDLPGHGKTAVFNTTHTMKFMAETVHAVLEQEAVKQCVVAGHSMGGYVALALVKMYPKLARGLVLFHSHAAPDSEQAKENRLRTIRIVDENRLAFIRNFIPELFNPAYVEKFTPEIEVLKQETASGPPEGIAAALRGMMEREDHRPFLKETAIPVLFIAGKADPKMPLQLILEQAALPAHAEALILGHAGHMGFIEAKNETLQAVRCFALKHLLGEWKMVK